MSVRVSIMLFATPMSIALGPRLPSFPYQSLLAAWLREEFDPARCRTAAERVLARREAMAEHFNADNITRGGPLLSSELLYPKDPTWRLDFVRYDSAAPDRWVTNHGFDLEGSDVDLGVSLLRDGLHGRQLLEFVRSFGYLGREFLRSVLASSGAASTTAGWAKVDGPGIYRREHASVLIASRTTRILVDPLSSFVKLPGLSSLPAPDVSETPDAIAITHGHGDHWSLPSLLGHLRDPKVPVIVPRVPCRNLLTPNDMRAELEACGQAALSPEWGSTLTIGDIEVDVLPFFGEQPTHDAPAPPEELRNWGNCYRFNTPEFSLVLLVDSGADPSGSMLDVMRRSLSQRGPADVVMSCLRVFASPFFGGLAPYWGALPFFRLRELYRDYRAGRLPATTAGPEGAARLCEAVGARYYLAYAHGFRGIGEPITDIGWGHGEPSEAAAAACVATAIAAAGGNTQVLSWAPGWKLGRVGRQLAASACGTA